MKKVRSHIFLVRAIPTKLDVPFLDPQIRVLVGLGRNSLFYRTFSKNNFGLIPVLEEA